jgi:cytochrome c5
MHPRFLIAFVLLALGFAVMALTNPDVRQAPATPDDAAEPAPPAPQAVVPPPGPRGQQLYENHCMGCHESLVHIRSTQSARSYRDLHERVAHWARYMKLPWSEEEVGDVARYLEGAYYRFEARP